MENCFICNYLEQSEKDDLILENTHAIAAAGNYFREGHCSIKHKDKCSLCVYCFEELFNKEGERNPSKQENIKLKNELKKIIE